MNTTETLIYQFPLTPEDHKTAKSFALEQPTNAKAKQIYLNTLSVLVCQGFLRWLEIETTTESCESWHSVIRKFQDVADLEIPGLGKIECRPVLPGETAITVPIEAREDRLAYVLVRFEESLASAKILGFIRGIELPEDGVIDCNNLVPMELFIDYIQLLEKGQKFMNSDEPEAVQMREYWEEEGIVESARMNIIAALETVLKLPAEEQRAVAGIVVTGQRLKAMASQTKEGGNEGESFVIPSRKISRLADKLLQKLAEVWEE